MLFNYLLVKDSGIFRNNSFIQLIPPYMFTEMSAALDKMVPVLSGNLSSQYDQVFGATHSELINEFFDLYLPYKRHMDYLNSGRNVFKYLADIAVTNPDNSITLDISRNFANFNMKEPTTFRSGSEVEADAKEYEQVKSKRKTRLDNIDRTGIFSTVNVTNKDKTKPFKAIESPLYFYHTVSTFSPSGQEESKETTLYKVTHVDGKPIKPSEIKSGRVIGHSIQFSPISLIGAENHEWLPFLTDLATAKMVSNYKITGYGIVQNIPDPEEDGPNFEGPNFDRDPSPDELEAIDSAFEPSVDSDLPDSSPMLNLTSEELGETPVNIQSGLGYTPPESMPKAPEGMNEETIGEMQDGSFMDTPGLTINPTFSSEDYFQQTDGTYWHSGLTERISEETYNQLLQEEQAKKTKNKDCDK
jgi:hypothetical protein